MINSRTFTDICVASQTNKMPLGIMVIRNPIAKDVLLLIEEIVKTLLAIEIEFGV